MTDRSKPQFGLSRRSILGGSAALLVSLSSGVAQAECLDFYALSGRWTRDDGTVWSLSRWHGRASVVSMAYGACRKVCSVTLRRMQVLQQLVDARGTELDFVVFSLDPVADRAEDWQALRSERKLQRSNWHFLSGTETETRQVATALGIRYWRYDEHVMHDFRIALISDTGRISKTLNWADDDVKALLEAAPASAC